MRSPFSIVKGKSPTKTEYGEWSHDKWLDFLSYLKFFIEPTDKGDMYKLTKEKLIEMNKFLDIGGHSFHEHIFRLNLNPDKDTPRECFYRFNAYARAGLTYLKKHPGIISVEMKKEMESCDRFSWALNQYKVEDSNGVEMVLRDNEVADQVEKKTVSMPSVQAKLMNSMLKMVDIYETLSESLTKQELRKLPTKEKLSALSKLAFVFQEKKHIRPHNQFTQININGGVKDAEKAMLEFVQKRQN